MMDSSTAERRASDGVLCGDSASGVSGSSARHGLVKLLLTCVAVGIVWGVVLPEIARQPDQQAWFRKLDSYGIEPMALFYTDHDLRFDHQSQPANR